ncbi:MAG: NrsF family protein [Beijerinckiaceae bacterium]|jgi:hypothetical protein|nr:NrsF family protein [Beijerinckiaceae bacterium]MDO9439849.1 NrsF family protein [Beijerinckiaceae bacterium]
MKTDDLIHALSQDAAIREPAPDRTLAIALAVGGVAAAIVFALLLGPREDFPEALHEARFVFKFILTGTLTAVAAMLASSFVRPTAPADARGWLLLAPLALIVGALALEMFATPSGEWAELLVGTNWLVCLTYVPIIAAAPLAALVAAMRRGAPTQPALAGALAGLASGALAAMLYAAHCPDDSPFFVAVWYGLAIGIVTVAGAFAGHRLLRW